MAIVNLLGEEIAILLKEKQAAGNYSFSWNGKDKLGNEVASGIYFCRLIFKDKNVQRLMSRKMVKLQ